MHRLTILVLTIIVLAIIVVIIQVYEVETFTGYCPRSLSNVVTSIDTSENIMDGDGVYIGYLIAKGGYTFGGLTLLAFDNNNESVQTVYEYGSVKDPLPTHFVIQKVKTDGDNSNNVIIGKSTVRFVTNNGKLLTALDNGHVCPQNPSSNNTHFTIACKEGCTANTPLKSEDYIKISSHANARGVIYLNPTPVLNNSNPVAPPTTGYMTWNPTSGNWRLYGMTIFKDRFYQTSFLL